MKIFFVGDFYSSTGPANVNKVIQKYNNSDDLFSIQKNIFSRLIELFIKIIISDAVVFSGLSKLHLIGIIFAKLVGKKTGYLMHGSCKYENEINGVSDKSGEETEEQVLEKVDTIICVSQPFMNWTKERYPKYKNKITFATNALDWNDLATNKSQEEILRDNQLVLSVGGGMPRKNIKSICKAINLLNKRNSLGLKLLVIGNEGNDSDEIKSYDFVEFISNVPFEKMSSYYQKAHLYIQNSSFETFGLAPLEALINGCNLLVSKNIGMLDVFNNYEENDVVFNPNNYEEIAEKIMVNLHDGNNKRLMSQINSDYIASANSRERFREIMENSKG